MEIYDALIHLCIRLLCKQKYENYNYIAKNPIFHVKSPKGDKNTRERLQVK